MENKFRGPTGQWLTRSLYAEPDSPFTLSHEDKGDRKSLRKLYLDAEDPTEYDFAEQHLGGWAHWQTMLLSSKFRAHVEEWRETLDKKLQARALKMIMDEASDPLNKGFLQANRFLYDKKYKDTQAAAKRPVGRPKKVEPELPEDHYDISDDHKRIFGNVPNTKARPN